MKRLIFLTILGALGFFQNPTDVALAANPVINSFSNWSTPTGRIKPTSDHDTVRFTGAGVSGDSVSKTITISTFANFSSPSGGKVSPAPGSNTLQVIGAAFNNLGGEPTMIATGPFVTVLEYMDGQNGRPTLAQWQSSPSSTDAAPAINAAAVAASLNNGTLILVPGLSIYNSIIIPANVTVKGLSAEMTSITSFVAGDYAIKVLGDYANPSPNITFDSFQIVPNASIASTAKGVYLQAVTKFTMKRVRINGFNGGSSLYISQMWDSWIDDSYIRNSTYSGATTVIDSGPSDNCNNIRWRGDTWEGNTGTPIQYIGGTGVQNQYNITFDACKWENPNTGPIMYASGTTVLSAMYVNNSMMGALSGTGPFFKMDSTAAVRGMAWTQNFFNDLRSGVTVPVLFELHNTKGFSLNYNRFYGSSTYTSFVTTADGSNQYGGFGNTYQDNSFDPFATAPANPLIFGGAFLTQNNVTGLTTASTPTFKSSTLNDTTGTANTTALSLQNSTVGLNSISISMTSGNGTGNSVSKIVSGTEGTTTGASYLAFQTRSSSGTISEAARFTSNGRHLLGTTTDNGVDILQANGSVSATAFKGAVGLAGTTASIGGGALIAGACASGTVSVTGATTSMSVVATPVTYPGDGVIWHGYVSSANTVTVKVCGAIAVTPTASAYNVRVLQ